MSTESAQKSHEQDLLSLVNKTIELSKTTGEFDNLVFFINGWLYQYDILITKTITIDLRHRSTYTSPYQVKQKTDNEDDKEKIIHTAYSFADALQWVFEYLAIKSTKGE